MEPLLNRYVQQQRIDDWHRDAQRFALTRLTRERRRAALRRRLAALAPLRRRTAVAAPATLEVPVPRPAPDVVIDLTEPQPSQPSPTS